MSTSEVAEVIRVRGGETAAVEDWLAVERALEIRVRTKSAVRVISTTMRTPGEDRALVAGFLVAEGVVRKRSELVSIETVDDDAVLVELGVDAEAALGATQRQFVTTGACGVCGRASIDSLATGAGGPEVRLAAPVHVSLIHGLPAALRRAQATFAQTGGLHAAGLFDLDGTPRAVHEDVGRHNAVDKLVGTLFLADRLPATDNILVVSGRASFELVQKASVAGFSMLVAVGAPSSLAVQIARAAEMTLLGFVRDGGFNVYSGAVRLAGLSPGGRPG